MEKQHLPITNANYRETMVAIYGLMDTGEQNLTEAEIENLAAMAQAAEKYEDENLKLSSAKHE